MHIDLETILNLLCSIPALVLGLTVHEFAHAWTADRLGDPTPRRMGRVSLDPAVHIDPLGALFFVICSLSGYGIGWAKPVPIMPRNMRHPRRDSMLVAIAGPISNLLQVPFWLLALWVFGRVVGPGTAMAAMDSGFSPTSMIFMALAQGITLNFALAAFNMIPFPPLDGHWVLQALGGREVEEFFDSFRQYSFIILIGIINLTPVLDVLLGPIEDFGVRLARAALFGTLQHF